MPHAERHADLAGYVDAIKGQNQKGFWANADAYTVSLLKAYFGDNATAENDYLFDELPKISGDHGTYSQVMDMIEGARFLGTSCSGRTRRRIGQRPAQRLGMANLDWMVVRDLVMIESATFWKDAPEVETGEIVTEECRTRCCSSCPPPPTWRRRARSPRPQRMLQWREKAVNPPGDATRELWFFYHLGRRMREKLAESTDPRDQLC